MIKQESVFNVLRKVMAAKAEAPAEAPAAPAQPAADRKRYYFFDARPESAITFTALKEILQGNSPEKQALLQKLQGGNSGKFFADYFQWKKVAVRTNQYSNDGRSYLVYECDLSPIGTKVAGSEKITPTDSPATPDQVERDFLLFEDKRGNSNVVNPDNSGESIYIDSEPPANLGRILLSGARPSGNLLTFDNFARKFDEYRIWAPNLNQLMLPNMEQPRTDDVPGGHYRGGQQAYEKNIAPYGAAKQPTEQVPAQPSLGEKMKEDKTPFEPVDEQPQKQEPVKGVFTDRMAAKKNKKKKKRQKGDFSSEPYSGGTNVMQMLVKDQRACMNVRKAARRVMGLVTKTSPTTTPTTTGTPSNQQPSIEITHDPKLNKEKAKKLDQYADKQDALQQEMKRTEQDMARTQKLAHRVASHFLKQV